MLGFACSGMIKRKATTKRTLLYKDYVIGPRKVGFMKSQGITCHLRHLKGLLRTGRKSQSLRTRGTPGFCRIKNRVHLLDIVLQKISENVFH